MAFARLQLAAGLSACLALSACGGSGAASSSSSPTAPQPAPRQSPAAAPTPVHEAGGPSASVSPAAPGAAAGVINHGPRTRRWVALTFDADMTLGMLAQLRSGRVRHWYDTPLLDELRATRTPATIFLTGLWTREYPQIVRNLARDRRFELENHSFDHAGWVRPCYGLPSVTGEPSKRGEVARARSIIRSVAHVTPRYFRFPGGCQNEADVRLVSSYGERAVGWDVVSGDAFQRDPRAIVRAVLAGVRPGSIVVAHCIGAPNTPATAQAMRTIIPALRARGYRFVTLRRLLGASA